MNPVGNELLQSKETQGVASGVSDSLFQLAFKNSPAMQSVVRAADGVLIEVNDTFLQKFQFKREEVIGKTPMELNFWLEPEKLLQYRAELESKGYVIGFEVRLRARDGTILTALLSSHRVEIAGVTHYVSAGIDITARKEAEAKLQSAQDRLRQSDERFGKAFRSSAAMMAITRESDGRIVSVNEAFLRHLGYSEAEVVGRTANDLQLHSTPEQREAFLRGLEQHGFIRDHEVFIRSKDGRVLTLLASGERTLIEGEPHVLYVSLDITERKEAEARLRESERRLRESEARMSTVFRASPAALSLGRLSDGRFVAVNEAFARLTGYSESEVVGRTSHELGLYAKPEAREVLFREIREKGCVRDYEYTLRAKDGQLRSMVMAADLVEVDGAPHVLVVASDISARKQAEENLRESERLLRESEARFSTAFRACPVLMNIARLPDGSYVEVNDAFSRWIRRSRKEILGHTWLEFAQWENLGEQDAFFAELERTRSVRNVECQLRLYDGRQRIVLVSADIIEINRAPHVLGFAIDITEQKKAEQSLRESEVRVRTLYESLSAAVAVQDETGFLQINSASLKLFGAKSPEEVLGKQPADFSAPRQPDGEDSTVAAKRHIATALARGSHRFEWMGRNLAGTEFPVEVTLTALQLEGRPAVQAVIVDLTERRRAEAELQNALNRERELSKLKSDFVALVSHEFRTPLEIIMSSADNLERYHDRLDVAKRQHLLRTIHKSVRRMSGMMGEVLVLGQVESGRTDFKPAQFDLCAFCQKITEEIQTVTSRRCPVELRFDEARRLAYGDESLLRHILSNLLSNAVKYSPEGNPVTLDVSRKGADAVFRVIDSGCGIPAADQPRLFQAFYRGGNVSQVPGTGLGLVIVRRCVELHGGKVEFESNEGSGTTFTVALPIFQRKET